MKTYELLTPPEIRRDHVGRFERKGTLAKTANKTGLKKKQDKTPDQIGGGLAGPGRPKGVPNRNTTALKDAILRALDRVGGDRYLAQLAIDNSSAFASLLARVLPHTLAADAESNGGAVTFTRIIVHPGGHREIEGVTPKSLPAPDASHALPRPTDPTDDTNEGVV